MLSTIAQVLILTEKAARMQNRLKQKKLNTNVFEYNVRAVRKEMPIVDSD